MRRKLVGALTAVVGLVLIAVAFVAAFQNSCPASTYNGTGPPPPTPPCTGHYSWAVLPLALLIIGILLIPIGGVVAFYRHA